MRVGLLLLGGCLVGGGPTIGYGQQGFSYGAEVSAGGAVLIPQVTAGAQPGFKYIRLDLPADLLGIHEYQDLRFAGRIGGGLAFRDGDAPTTGMFVAGAGAGHYLWDGTRCGGIRAAASVELQVRYQDGWSVVLAPRIEGVWEACLDSDN